MTDRPRIETISAVTLIVSDMARSLGFYTDLGFELRYGSPSSDFASFAVGDGYLNLARGTPPDRSWGRIVLYVDDVDEMFRHVEGLGLAPETHPADADWGERYFHLRDPDHHELSFAHPLP